MWIIKIQCFWPPRILNEHWGIYSCLQIPPRDNWFQYVRRQYANKINFPCITFLDRINCFPNMCAKFIIYYTVLLFLVTNILVGVSCLLSWSYATIHYGSFRRIGWAWSQIIKRRAWRWNKCVHQDPTEQQY